MREEEEEKTRKAGERRGKERFDQVLHVFEIELTANHLIQENGLAERFDILEGKEYHKV